MTEEKENDDYISVLNNITRKETIKNNTENNTD